MKKKFLAALITGTMVLSLVGCGGGSKPATKDTTDTTGTAKTESTDAGKTETKTETAGATEDLGNKLVFYSSMTDDDVNSVLDGFNALYPDIEVEVVNGSAGELTARITAEADNPQGDVMWGGLPQTDGDSHADIFEPYLSDHESEVYDDYKSNNGFYNYSHLSTVVLCVNTKLEEKAGIEIKGYKDLLNPALKGQIIFSDPNSSSAAWNNLCNIMAVYGNDSDEAWALMKGLIDNGMIISDSSSKCFKAVADGEYIVGLTYEDGASTLLKSGADNIRLVYPEEGTSATAMACAMIKGAPHQAAAKAMINYLLSAEGQAERAESLGTIRMTNANAKYNTVYIPATEDIKWVSRDINWLIENKQQVLDHWNELVTSAQ